jgi:FAD/FMN-containing dehydrogenase/Fe-S oxidoreductase
MELKQKKKTDYTSGLRIKKDGHFKSSPSAENVRVEALKKSLKERIEGEVKFDDGSRALYATDGSNYRQIPIGVVFPKTEEDIINTVALCKQYDAPVLSRGGGTSLAGQCCNVAVVMDFSRYHNRLISVDKDQKIAKAETGAILDHIKAETVKSGLIFAPDPATHSHCTIGGMIGNNSCGVHSVISMLKGEGPRVSDNLRELTILTYDGVKMKVGATSEEELEQIIKKGGRKAEIYSKLRDLRDKYADLIRKNFPKLPRRVSGYNLDDLLPENGFNVARALAGSEGTCVVMLDATLNLLPNAEETSLLILGYDNIFHAGDHAAEMFQFDPIGIEGMDDELIGYMRKRGLHQKDLPLLPEGRGWLLVEFGGATKQEAEAKARKAMDLLKEAENPPSMQLFNDPEKEDKIWAIRESGLGATAFVPGMQATWPGWEDTAVPPKQVGHYLRDLEELFETYNYDAALYGHFGQGCVHCRINFDLTTPQGIAKYNQFTYEAADLVVKYGGSISGEHGDGQARADLLEKMYGPEIMQAFREFKEIWDPEWKMNPGKVIDAHDKTQNLRLGSHYDPKDVKTFFKYPNDSGSFANATLRCVGVGKCRREEGGTMCPSWRATHDEKHVTRGRAHMLFEMLQGDVIKDGWKDENVKESLDLCLSCKGCKGDCPVNVDIATYKAEFLAHYYKGKLRPRAAYAFGFINKWARMASKFPVVANFFTQAPGLSGIAKKVAGIDQRRQIPQFADYTFRQWFEERKPVNEDKPGVILWVDTFNNYFYPETLIAATEVLEDAGFRVNIPDKPLCCGRPLYDFGFLGEAQKYLLEILNRLKEQIQEGIAVISLEPSCAAVFRDELAELFPKDENARRLRSQTYTLAEFLEVKVSNYKYPDINKKATVHAHCHHKAIMKLDTEYKFLEKAGLDFELLDSGCCGMAGNFGFEEGEKYEVSAKCGEDVLLPAVRKADDETLIITNGFSCREMIRQHTGRKALHMAEVLQMALRE